MDAKTPLKTRSEKENQSPTRDDTVVKAAAIVSLIETTLRQKPLFTVADCMRLAGAPDVVAKNKNAQQRVRRHAKKLNMMMVLEVVDESLEDGMSNVQSTAKTRVECFFERSLKAAMLIHLVDASAHSKPSLSAAECMLHAGLPPRAAADPDGHKILSGIVSRLDIDVVVLRVDEKLRSKKIASCK